MSDLILEEVLEEYAAATPLGNDLTILAKITEKYPQFESELADFAAARAIVRHAPELELSSEEQKRFQESGLQNLRDVLNSMNSAKQPKSLIDAAKARNLNRSKFAAAVGLSVSLVQYLEKRRLAFETIPKSIIVKIAEILELTEDSIANYLNQSPDYAAQASFKTETRAEQLAPKSFCDAVREDQQLSAEDKDKLLNFR